jgi:hypothetical protein
MIKPARMGRIDDKPASKRAGMHAHPWRRDGRARPTAAANGTIGPTLGLDAAENREVWPPAGRPTISTGASTHQPAPLVAATRCGLAEGRRSVDSTLLLLLVPVVLIQLLLLIWGLYDLTRPGRRVRGDSKVLWGLVIVFVNIVGPVVYFLFGREET